MALRAVSFFFKPARKYELDVFAARFFFISVRDVLYKGFPGHEQFVSHWRHLNMLTFPVLFLGWQYYGANLWPVTQEILCNCWHKKQTSRKRSHHLVNQPKLGLKTKPTWEQAGKSAY